MPVKTKPPTSPELIALSMLAGKSVRLRPLSAEDRAISVRWRNDPEIRDNVLGYRFPVTEAMEADWINAVLTDQSRTRLLMAIEDKSDAAFVGFVYLTNIDWFSRVAEFGILLGDRSRHGKGLARDVLEVMTGYVFDELNLNKLWLRVAAFNAPALRLYRGFGFVEEGVQRQQAYVRGQYHDVILFGLLREDYLSSITSRSDPAS